MFIGRSEEMQFLNRHYESNEEEFIVMYGRRRVGKTELIREFIKDKQAIYFPALEANAHDNLVALSKAIYEFLHPEFALFPEYASFDSAFSVITDICSEQRIVFVIDEFPYLCDADPSVTSRLQHLLDHDWKECNMFLILCGSSISFMEKKVLSEKSPLFGRRTGQIKLEPLAYWDAAKFHPELSAEENALIYGITGGVPHYINKLNVKGNIKDALLQNFFDKNSYLFEEPENLLRQELRDPSTYNSVISSIASGKTKLNEIASSSHMETGACSNCLSTLTELGITEKVTPITGHIQRKSYYRIKDNLFRFWYRFVPQNLMAIYSGHMELVYQKSVESYLHDYMGQTFESMCRSWLVKNMDQLPFIISDIGEWWGNDPKQKKEIQLDIVAPSARSHQDTGGRKYLIGSCKYKNEKTDIDELYLIHDYASVFTSSNDICYYYIFSLNGFTDKLRKTDGVRLITLEDLYK